MCRGKVGGIPYHSSLCFCSARLCGAVGVRVVGVRVGLEMVCIASRWGSGMMAGLVTMILRTLE